MSICRDKRARPTWARSSISCLAAANSGSILDDMTDGEIHGWRSEAFEREQALAKGASDMLIIQAKIPISYILRLHHEWTLSPQSLRNPGHNRTLSDSCGATKKPERASCRTRGSLTHSWRKEEGMLQTCSRQKYRSHGSDMTSPWSTTDFVQGREEDWFHVQVRKLHEGQ